MAGDMQTIVQRLRERWARAGNGDVDYPFCAIGDDIDPDDRNAVDRNLLRIFNEEKRHHPPGTPDEWIMDVIIFG